ncbi:DUF4232 domain-containing protein [Streptomyces sp. NPDC059122]|uniref:DUF4232 domain-containing protein n=1 Tax=unclassified Streptomyces TaxID=2593676 RepID=UPI0036A9D936
MSSDTAVRTTRRRTLRVAAAALTAVAGLTLTACSGADLTGAKAPGGTASGVNAAGVDAPGSSGPGSSGSGSSDSGSSADGSGSSADGSGSSADAAGSGTGAGSGAKAKAEAKRSGGAHATGGRGSGVERCHTSGLKASFATGGDAAPDPKAGGATTTSVVLTNKSGRTCVIGGFPGVDLTSENGGERWSLARSSAKHGSITLGPGDSTDFTINLAMTEENEGFYQPAWAQITPPNETKSITIAWPWGTLVDQRAATHPGTFVNPIG